MVPLYIFDLDGTLALIDHRRHLVQLSDGSPVTIDGHPGTFRGHNELIPGDYWVEFAGTGKWSYSPSDVAFKPNWPAFFAACVDDRPNWPVISTMNAVLKSGADVWIWSGRSAEVMNETRTWLQRFFEVDADEVVLTMRREGDYTPDEILKASWLDGLNEYDRRRLVAVFDDRQKVVDMWRARGVACFQVAPGNF